MEEGSSTSGKIFTCPVYAAASAAWFHANSMAVNASVDAVVQGLGISLMTGARVQREEENTTEGQKK